MLAAAIPKEKRITITTWYYLSLRIDAGVHHKIPPYRHTAENDATHPASSRSRKQQVWCRNFYFGYPRTTTKVAFRVCPVDHGSHTFTTASSHSRKPLCLGLGNSSVVPGKFTSGNLGRPLLLSAMTPTPSPPLTQATGNPFARRAGGAFGVCFPLPSFGSSCTSPCCSCACTLRP